MVLKVIYYILLSITLIYGAYFAVSGFIGVVKKNKFKFKESDVKSFFAILIPARNEEKTIGNLIESLKKLDYPKDKYEIFVIPNNCIDNTINIAKNKGASIIECNIPVEIKGDVLKYAFNVLKENKKIDAYLIFDADNVVHKDFLTNMNKCLNSGYNVAQGFRDSKNPTDNWISSSYTIFYLLQNIFFNKARMSLNASALINGTGFMISKKIIDNGHFKTQTITEDIEFTGQCALNCEKVAFVEDAITYDEHPDKFIVSWKQRRRWSAGLIECMKKYSFKLFKNYINIGNMASLDMALVYLGPVMQAISCVDFILLIMFKIFKTELNDMFLNFFVTCIIPSLIFMLLGIFIEIFVLKYKKKGLKGMFTGIILFSIFILSWIPINIICFFKRNIKWEEIKHNKDIKISDIK